MADSKNKHVVRVYVVDVTACFPTFGSNLAVLCQSLERKALPFLKIL
jgi:hypothetical protein